MRALAITAIIISVSLVAGTLGYVISTPDVFAAKEKITLCHKPGTPAEQTISIFVNALDAHLAHGDFVGTCETPPPTGNLVSCICELGDIDPFCIELSCDNQLELMELCQTECTAARFGPLFLVGCQPDLCSLEG